MSEYTSINDDSTHLSTSDLWMEFTQGSKKSFSLIYTKYYPKLLSYATNLGMSKATASDGIQDIFLKLYMRPDLIKNPLTLRSLLFRSTKNYFLNTLKHEKKSISLDNVDYFFSFQYTIDDKIIAEDEQNEIKQKIDNLLSTLTSRQREIIYLRFLDEMEYEEIARIMDISEQGARNLIYKAFEKIRGGGNPELVLILLLYCKVI